MKQPCCPGHVMAIHTYTHIHTHETHTDTYMHTHTQTHRRHTGTYMHTHTYNGYTHTHTYIYTHTSTCTHKHTWDIQADTCKHTHVMATQTDTDIHTYMRYTQTPTCTHTNTHIIATHRHMHTHTGDTHTDTYMHTHTILYYRDTWIFVFIAAVLTQVGKWKQPIYSSTDEWILKICNICTPESYLSAGKWMALGKKLHWVKSRRPSESQNKAYKQKCEKEVCRKGVTRVRKELREGRRGKDMYESMIKDDTKSTCCNAIMNSVSFKNWIYLLITVRIQCHI